MFFRWIQKKNMIGIDNIFIINDSEDRDLYMYPPTIWAAGIFGFLTHQSIKKRLWGIKIGIKKVFQKRKTIQIFAVEN